MPSGATAASGSPLCICLARSEATAMAGLWAARRLRAILKVGGVPAKGGAMRGAGATIAR